MAFEVVNATPDDDLARAYPLNNLACILASRYDRKGSMDDLNDAIGYLTTSVELGPRDAPGHAGRLNNLGIRLCARWERTGSVNDLNRSIDVLGQAIQITESRRERPSFLTNLSGSLGRRFDVTGSEVDLDHALEKSQEAVRTVHERDPQRPAILNDLGIRYSQRFDITNSVDDLIKAIKETQLAVDLVQEDHPDRPSYLQNLAIWCWGLSRANSTLALENMNRAIECARLALAATSDIHPNHGGLSNLFGCLLGMRAQNAEWRSESDLRDAIEHCISALHNQSSPPFERVHAGGMALTFLALDSRWKEAYEAAHIALQLMPQLTLRSLESTDKQYMFSRPGVIGLAANAAAAALSAGQHPMTALDLLESGRGVLVASHEELRTDVLELQKNHPQLAKSFADLRDELCLPVTQSSIDRRYNASQEFNRLIERVRQSPGFEDFLLPPSKEHLQFAAIEGPIVVINISEFRCDAILIESDKIWSIDLPRLSRADVEEKSGYNNFGDLKILQWLWDVIAGPVLEALGFTRRPPSDEDWPHVWWIPTGPLSKFPLHAAGYHSSSSSDTVLDRVMSSYSTSPKALINGRQRQSLATPFSKEDQVLLIAMPSTPGLGGLSNASKEISKLRELCTSMGLQVSEPKTRKADVLLLLPKCKIFHFAGHGSTDANDPSKSFLALEDWETEPLTVGKIMEISLRDSVPFLAFLSACGTGRIKEDKFLDEHVHLIASFQLAGYRHVIGTMWDVRDETCVDVANDTYAVMGRKSMSNKSVCLGLHRAIRRARDGLLKVQDEREMNGDDPGASNEREPTLKLKKPSAKLDKGIDHKLLSWVPYVHYGI